MKVTYQTCYGVDVHKSFLVATIVKTTGDIEPFYQKKRLPTFSNSILESRQRLLDNDCHDACMEPTGKYWVPAFSLLEDDINVVIVNPKWVKAVKDNKDNTKDSKWIGDSSRLGLVRGSYVPRKRIRILREYTRYRYKLIFRRSGEKNRYQNALTVCSAALDSVVSDIFGKSSTSIIGYLLEQSGASIDHEEVAPKLLRSLKSKEDAVIESAKGYRMADTQEYRMRLVRAHMDYIIAEIGTDMSQSSSPKRLCCWAGLTSGSNESVGKKRSVQITCAGVCPKPALVQCAHAAVKSDKPLYYKKKYDPLVKRHGKRRAIIAITRMILTAIYQMTSVSEQWNPSDLYKIDMPVALVEKQKAKVIKQVKKLLQREELLPPDGLLAS